MQATDFTPASPSKKLVILDVNKILCLRKCKKALYYEGVQEFVSKLLELYQVAIWSSAKEKNTTYAINRIFGEDAKKLTFVWFRDRCVKGFGHNATLKPLALVFSNAELSFDATNTIIIDDSIGKMTVNRYENYIVPRIDDPSVGPNYNHLLDGIADRFLALGANKSLRYDVNKLRY